MINTSVHVYGIFIFLSIIVGIIITCKNSKSDINDKFEMICFIFYIILGTIFGAKYFTLLSNFGKYKNYGFFEIGLSSYGAVIGLLVMIIIFSKQFKKNIENILYDVIPVVPIMYSIGKIGCFFVGCCYGVEYNGIFSITYNYSYSAPNFVKLFPTQLVESLLFLIIFIYLSFKKKKENDKTKIICDTIILCSLSKFILDYCRNSHKNTIVSINQIVSLMFCLIFIYIRLKRKKVNGRLRYLESNK